MYGQIEPFHMKMAQQTQARGHATCLIVFVRVNEDVTLIVGRSSQLHMDMAAWKFQRTTCAMSCLLHDNATVNGITIAVVVVLSPFKNKFISRIDTMK
jgi:hypothetical protein